MSKQKQKGTSFETQVAEYLSKAIGKSIERRCLHGVNDCGDISGVEFMGMPVAIECKNHRRMELAEWCDEAEREAANADARHWAVIHKRKGCGEKSFGKTYVTTSLENFACWLVQGFDKSN